MKWSRKDYMDKKVDHQTYFGQFVTSSIKSSVASRFGKRIEKSTDPHFNDIPLREWDNMAPMVRSCAGRSISESNASTCAEGITQGGISLSDCVCVLKSAARMIKEGV